ncbi:hypothetical protein B0H14DRAFT_2786709 [Mycena olivaceomarginata]|nr:hypothetical protein B0H14DRAFT_2786709 [Mycena olivaceomarginata]
MRARYINAVGFLVFSCQSSGMTTSQPTLLAASGVQGGKAQYFYGCRRHLALAATGTVAFAIILWEYATLLPEEIRLYRRSVWTTTPPYGFLALRYGSILATFPVLFLSTAENVHCQVGVVLVVASSGIIFAIRTSLLWSDDWNVRGALSGLLGIVTVCWIAVATQYRAVTAPVHLFGSNCRVFSTAPWMPLGNAVFTSFLLITLILTLLKFRSHLPRDSLVIHLIYRANLLYLLGTTLTAATAFLIQIISPPSSPLALCTQPIATVFIVAFGTRAFRNMALANALDADRTAGLPMADMSKSPSIFSDESEMRFAPAPNPPPTRSLPAPTASIGTPRSPITGPTRPRLAHRQLESTSHGRLHCPCRPLRTCPFSSPPGSYTAESLLSASVSVFSSSMQSTSPLRPSRSGPDSYYMNTDQPPPGSASYPSRSPLSDSLHQPRAV